MTSNDRSALIFGISGQDGAYLAKLLLDQGYIVHGTSRDVEGSAFAGLRALGILDQVRVHSATLQDFRSVAQIIQQVEDPFDLFPAQERSISTGCASIRQPCRISAA